MTLVGKIRENLSKVMVGKDEVADLLLIALICGGHALIEDVPGLGKTTMARALAKSLGCTFGRIQFTPDVLPADVTGYTAYRLATGERELRPGAVMHQILLADEINRTSPKTQASLLEAMQEGQVTIDGETVKLPRPFFVLATQNPAELTGTYPLPEAQLDRFLLRIPMGYPSKREEIEILSRHRTQADPLDAIGPVADAGEIAALQNRLREITVAPELLGYIADIAAESRRDGRIALGVSPRGSIALMNASAARALLDGRAYALPEDVRRMAVPVLAHRIVPDLRASVRDTDAASLVRDVLDRLPVPGVAS